MVATSATFLGLTPEAWTALSTFLLAVITCLLVLIGLIQINSIRAEGQRSRTLAMCDRYDSDPVIDACLRRLAEGRRTGALLADPVAFRPDIATVLNYLDSLAVGIQQGLYIEELARDHIESILRRHVNQYFGHNGLNVDGIDPANYARLIALSQSWSNNPPRFRDKRKWFRRRST